MKKFLKLLFFPLFFFSLCGCSSNGGESSYKYPINEYIDIDLSSVKLQKDSYISLSYSLKQKADIEFKTDNSNITILDKNSVLTIYAKSIGEAKLYVNLRVDDQSYTLGQKDISIVKKVFYLPVPEHKLVFKGAGNEANVGVILLDNSVTDKPIWSISDDTIISLDHQDFLAHITSLKRGICTVTFSLGEISESFDVYVTNIRGDI